MSNLSFNTINGIQLTFYKNTPAPTINNIKQVRFSCMMIQIAAAKMVPQEELDLELFYKMDVQLVFRSRTFPDLDHKKAVSLLNRYEIKPISIHFPPMQGLTDEAMDILKMLRDIYQQTLFTIHPKFPSFEIAVNEITAREKQIFDLGVTLAYENMPGPRGKWMSYPKIVASLPFTRFTFDITHLEHDMNDIEELSQVIDRTDVIHLSNVTYKDGVTNDHLRINEGDRDIAQFLKYVKTQNYSGQIILEYMTKTVCYLREDMKTVESLLI